MIDYKYSNPMPRLILLLVLLFSFATTNAQKFRLEGDDSEYLCLNDSLADLFENALRKKGADNIISVLYDTDNGRLQTTLRAVIWTHKGIDSIRLIQGCDQIMKDTTISLNLSGLWQYINTTRFEDMSIPILSGTGQSHDKFYVIQVKTPKKEFQIAVRENERRPSVKHPLPEVDTRIALTNRIAALLK